MRALEKRLRRLEEGLLPEAETAEYRRLHEIDFAQDSWNYLSGVAIVFGTYFL